MSGWSTVAATARGRTLSEGDVGNQRSLAINRTTITAAKADGEESNAIDAQGRDATTSQIKASNLQEEASTVQIDQTQKGLNFLAIVDRFDR